MTARYGRLIAAISSSALAASPVHAQGSDASDLSAEELQSLFENQRTRGLVIAPGTGSGAAATAGTTTATPTAARTDYVELDRDEQVNIRISFDFDSAALREDQKPKLTTLCQVMQNVDVQLFRIVGHTDAVGSAAYNQRLSLLRAQEVKRHLCATAASPRTGWKPSASAPTSCSTRTTRAATRTGASNSRRSADPMNSAGGDRRRHAA
jgi:OmpA-OmpF porin, OOP family